MSTVNVAAPRKFVTTVDLLSAVKQGKIEGLTNQQVADKLGLKKATFEQRMSKIRSTLKNDEFSEATKLARESSGPRVTAESLAAAWATVNTPTPELATA